MKKKKNRMEERIPVPYSLTVALSAIRLKKLSQAIGMSEDRLTSIVIGRTAKLRRYEILAIKDYIENNINTFIWDAEQYR